ncbi:MAG: hypothetical protein JSR31_16465 [Nitrospira sp.]|nr:hypothetical protein [Nitrospira sp.]
MRHAWQWQLLALVRPSFVALFLLVVNPALSDVSLSAEWYLLDGNDKAKVYVDRETINRTGDVVTVWVLDDLKTPHTRGFTSFSSVRAHEEHDCSKERFRLVALEQFAGNMGTGGLIYKKSGESGWSPIPRGTMAQSVWKFVCGKN